MIRFECDYLEGADEKVLHALVRSNQEQTIGYGEDAHCEHARAMIRALCDAPDAGVHFFMGGTQANLTLIAAALRPHEGALCADTGHIAVHETGAVEATGHKALTLPGERGKITAEQIDAAVEAHLADATHEHMVKPALVYISEPTELGTLYSRDELRAISDVCRARGLWLYVDGARLGYALAADDTLDLAFLASVCDAFTIGGTKVGALFGEAMVISSSMLNDCFRYHIKQRGGMLAKGRLLGVQFEALMADGRYVDVARRANALAQRMKQAFLAAGCPMLCDTITNQIFPILSDRALAALAEEYTFAFWQKVDQTHTAVRFCASVTTDEGHVEKLIADIRAILAL